MRKQIAAALAAGTLAVGLLVGAVGTLAFGASPAPSTAHPMTIEQCTAWMTQMMGSAGTMHGGMMGSGTYGPGMMGGQYGPGMMGR